MRKHKLTKCHMRGEPKEDDLQKDEEVYTVNSNGEVFYKKKGKVGKLGLKKLITG